MNPIELLYSWQAVMVAVAGVGVTQLVKTVIDLAYGRDKRKASPVLNRLVMPLTPIIFCFLFAAFIPVRPEGLIEYVVNNVEGELLQRLVYGSWGAACGQFADYLYQRAKKTLVVFRDKPVNTP